jgi:hypothetical protein
MSKKPRLVSKFFKKLLGSEVGAILNIQRIMV